MASVMSCKQGGAWGTSGGHILAAAPQNPPLKRTKPTVVQQEFVPVHGSKAAAPKFEPSVVFATWEGAYITSGERRFRTGHPLGPETVLSVP